MTGVLIIMAVASAGMILSRLLRLPHVPVLIALGILASLGEYTLDQDFLQNGLLFGLAFLVFATGISMSPLRVGIHGADVFRIGSFQIILTVGFGFLLSLALGYSRLEAFYISFGLAASSTLVVIKLLQSRGQLFEPFGRVVVGVLLMQDIILILVASIVTHIDSGTTAALRGLLTVTIMTLATLTFSKWIVPRILLGKSMDEEQQMLVALGVLFLFLGAANLLDVHMIAGAFLAGVSLSSFPVSGILRSQLAPLVDFFSAVFFVSIGLLIELPDFSAALNGLGLILFVLFLTPTIVAWVGYKCGLTLRSSIEAGLLLALASEFSIVLAMIGVQEGHLNREHLSLIAMIALSTMILAPFIATDSAALWLSKVISKGFSKKPRQPQSLRNRIVLIGCGESGIKLIQRLKHVNEPVVAIDRDPAMLKQVRELEIEAINADGGNPDHLEYLALNEAKLIISTMTKTKDHQAVLGRAGKAPVMLRVFDKQEASKLTSDAREAVPVSKVAAEEFIEWGKKQGFFD